MEYLFDRSARIPAFRVGGLALSLAAALTFAACSDSPVEPVTSVTGQPTLSATSGGVYRAYVTDPASDALLAMETATNTISETIPVGESPRLLAITPDGAFAYVEELSSVVVIETATNSVVANIDVPATDVELTPDGAFAYVAGGGQTSVIETATNTVVDVIATPPSTQRLEITPDGDHVWLQEIGSGAISILETATNTVVTTITVGGNPSDVAFTPDGAFAYLVDSSMRSGRLVVVDVAARAVAQIVALPPSVSSLHVEVTPNGDFAYVTLHDFDDPTNPRVAVVETATNTVVTTVPLPGNQAFDLAITPDGACVWVVNPFDREIVIIESSTNTVTETVSFGSTAAPWSVAFTPAITDPLALAGLLESATEAIANGNQGLLAQVDAIQRALARTQPQSAQLRSMMPSQAHQPGTVLALINSYRKAVEGRIRGGVIDADDGQGLLNLASALEAAIS